MISNALNIAGTIVWVIIFLAIFALVFIIAVEAGIHLVKNRKELAAKFKKKFLAKKKHADVVAIFESTKTTLANLHDEGTRNRALVALEAAFQIEDDDEAIAKIRVIFDHATKLISMQNPNANKEA